MQIIKAAKQGVRRNLPWTGDSRAGVDEGSKLTNNQKKENRHFDQPEGQKEKSYSSNQPDRQKEKSWSTNQSDGQEEKFYSFDQSEGQKEKSWSLNRLYGLAIDIGTTTVEMSLLALHRSGQMAAQAGNRDFLEGETAFSGALLRTLQEKNAQVSMGADIMMRLMHCKEGRQSSLEQLIREQLDQMTVQICRGNCEPREIRRVVIVGNPAMCHLVLGMDVSGLAGSPFVPAYRGAFRCKGKQLGLRTLAEAELYIVAGIDAHVGADAVAMAVASGMGLHGDSRGSMVGQQSLQAASLECCGALNQKVPRLAIDIGTNAELVLTTAKRVLACSVAAGPAFEGATISKGMRGEAGAIAGVRIAAGVGNIILEVIGWPQYQQVRGICGSGLIDAIAALLQCGILQADGYLLTRQEAIAGGIPSFLTDRIVSEGFLLYRAGENQQKNEEDLLLTREDIRQYQLAKAAVGVGIDILLEQSGCELSELKEVVIAGSFGGHISLKNAIRTGLLPELPLERYVIVGNAALSGAEMALKEPEFCRRMEEFAEKACHTELADRLDFQQRYLQAMALQTRVL